MNKDLISKFLQVLFIAMFFAFFSCNNEEKENIDTPVAPFELKIDSLNAAEFAKLLVEDLYNSDEVSTRSKINIDYEGDSNCVADLLAVKEVFSELDLYTQLRNQIMLGADLKFQRIESYFNEKIVWLRLFTAPLEINYYRLNLKVINNTIVISEYRSFMRGAGCNEMMEELVDLVCIKKQLSLEEVTKGFQLIDSTVKAFDVLDSERAALYFSKIDLTLRESKIISAIKYNLDFHSSGEIRLGALNSSKINYTGRKGKFTPWIWFNHFYINMEEESYYAARTSFPGLRFAVGNDPILTYLEATTYFEEYKYDKALELYNEALIAEPTIPNIHFAKVICLIEMNEYVQAVESLLVMGDYFDVTNTNWDKEFMAYPAFLISDEYSQWLERVEAIDVEM